MESTAKYHGKNHLSLTWLPLGHVYVCVQQTLPLCPQRFFVLFCHLLICFQNLLFRKILSGFPSECQTDWILIRPNIVSSLIGVQSVFKGYQQKTLYREEFLLFFDKSNKQKVSICTSMPKSDVSFGLGVGEGGFLFLVLRSFF